jgi:hypothetical protein
MPASMEISLISRKYRDAFGATLTPSFGTYMHCGSHAENGAALGYKRADERPLFLERYLDRSVEQAVSEAFGRTIARVQIVEIGNFAADNALAMIELWGAAANDLGGSSEVAVATLTAPLRGMFARIGLPVIALAPASPDRLGAGAQDWGSYYELDPQVCAGLIGEGQRAIATFLQRRRERQAA